MRSIKIFCLNWRKEVFCKMSDNRFKKGLESIKKVEESQENNTLHNANSNIITNINPNLKLNTSDILEKVLQKEKKEEGQAITLYFSSKVSKELTKLSEKTNKSKSKIVDEILGLVLFSKINPK